MRFRADKKEGKPFKERKKDYERKKGMVFTF